MSDLERPIPDGYVWDNTWAPARRRLALLEGLYDPGTQRRIAGLGVKPGSSCLEVAGGGGTVAEFLCRAVGPEGRVVTVDLDTRFLRELDLPNLEVIERDVVADGLPGGAFDLVHARALLMHLNEREELLAAFAAVLRPGGWLLVEEGDKFPIDAVDEGAYRAAWRIIKRVAAPAGLDTCWARQLPGRLCALGLADVDCQMDGSFFTGGSAGAQFIQMTLAQTLEKVPLAEDERQVLEDAIAELDDAGRWFPSFVMVAAWGRRA
ncbi:MAG: methyltransferase domain-containing protein [Acidimicrobiia bacterium]